MDERVKLTVSDGAAYIMIDRPDAKNALTKSMYLAIAEACLAAEKDPQVGAVVIRGAGGSFAVGGDLKEILDVLESDRPTDILDYEDYLPFETVRSLSKPTIAYVDGLCLGGGLTLALMCDLCLASDQSRFAIPEAKVGIVDGHLPRLLRSVVPAARLRHWMYTGALFSAAEAYDAGLLTSVVAPDHMEEMLETYLRQLRESSLDAIKACKRILNEAKPLSPMTDAFLALLQPEVLTRLQRFKGR